MPKGCCGASGTCACVITGSGAISVSGSGLPTDPFVIDAENNNWESSTNKTFTTIIEGDGSSADPLSSQVQFSDTAALDDFPDVLAPSPTNGYVLAWDGAQAKWVPQAPTTASAGSVLHDTSLDGDGSSGTPLAVLPEPNRLLGTFPNGIGLTDTGMSSLVQKFVDEAARDAAVPNPFLNQLVMLDTEPGVIYYWTGVEWSVLPNQTVWEVPLGAMLELSGAYTDGVPVTVAILQMTSTTDEAGNFDVLGTTELAGRSGVLTALFTEQGGTPWKAMLNASNNKIVGTAYRITDGSVMAGTPVSGTVQAILY
jgi:hypothetical protein